MGLVLGAAGAVAGFLMGSLPDGGETLVFAGAAPELVRTHWDTLTARSRAQG